jgi:hypothetical protein
MGRAMTARKGFEYAHEFAQDITRSAPRELFLSGARGEKRPTVRPAKTSQPE